VINEEKDHVCSYLLSQPTEETASEWGTSDAIREVRSKLEALSEEERKKLIEILDS